MKIKCALLWLILTLPAFAALTPVNLRCDYAVNPAGVDSAQPRLFWQVESARRGARQSAYEILAASSVPDLARDHGDLWASGKILSDETLQIPYAAGFLESARVG
jgi:alpha-L-rhamnosidase